MGYSPWGRKESDTTEAPEQALMQSPTIGDRLIEQVTNSFCLSYVNLSVKGQITKQGAMPLL